jgi:hypothetical protein
MGCPDKTSKRGELPIVIGGALPMATPGNQRRAGSNIPPIAPPNPRDLRNPESLALHPNADYYRQSIIDDR